MNFTLFAFKPALLAAAAAVTAGFVIEALCAQAVGLVAAVVLDAVMVRLPVRADLCAGAADIVRRVTGAGEAAATRVARRERARFRESGEVGSDRVIRVGRWIGSSHAAHLAFELDRQTSPCRLGQSITSHGEL